MNEFKKNVIIVLFFITFAFTSTSVATYLYFANDLQTKEGIMNRRDAGIILLDRNSNPFFTFYDAKNKSFVPLSQIPIPTQLAIIAAEDEEFYNHSGFSIKGIIRSFILNLTNSRVVYGGSTITQQLVKNSLLRPTKSFLRKYQEIILAYEIERRYSKKEILEMYLNSVYFGEGAFGIEEAAQVYFNKNANDLNVAESAVLASLLPAPSSLSPFSNELKEVKKRQIGILQRMLENGYVTARQKEQAEKEPLVLNPTKGVINSIAPHFALMVRQELIDRYGEEYLARSGFKVTTTLDSRWQEYAEQSVKKHVLQLARNNAHNGAVVVIDPRTGEIRAMVGSKNWYDDVFGKYNVAESPRQPGSAFKPITYAAAIERGIITPTTILKDVPTTFPGGYRPVNYDRKFRGMITARRALANSINVASIDVLQRVGIEPTIETANDLGITTLRDPSQYGLSLVLGAAEVKLVELTAAYSVFANYGYKNKATAIQKIEDKLGNIIYSHQVIPQQSLKPETAFLISSILSDNAARAEVFGNTLTISRPAAVKTGTTEDYKDAWTVGYTPSLAIGVWVGNNDNAPMDQVAGSLGAAPIWRDLMEHFLADTPIETFNPPSNIVIVEVCRNSSAKTQEYFIRGTEPTPAATCFITKPPSPSATTSLTPTPSIPTPTISPTIIKSHVNFSNQQRKERES